MQDLYKRLIESTNNAIFSYTVDDGRIIVANQGFVGMMGLECPPSEVTGKLLKELIVYVEPEGTIRQALDKAGELHNFEYHFKTLKGEDKWAILDAFFATDPATNTRTVELMARDISSRKLAEEALKISEENYRTIFETASDAIFIHDIESAQIVDVNQKA